MQVLQAVEHLAATFRGDPFRTVQVKNSVLVGAETGACVFAREEAASPEPGDERLASLALGHQGDKVREVLVHCAEPMGKPSSHTGSPRKL